MPKVQWNEKSMRYSMCFFPLVGGVIGLCSFACLYGLEILGMGKTAIAAILSVLPIILNGGIHMDGFLDTVDAKSSYRSIEEKLEILKDPHTGAFAIIYGMVYMMLCFGLFSEITKAEIGFIAGGYVYSRILSGLSIVTLKKARKDGMAAATASAAEKKVTWILCAELLICGIVFIYFHLLKGIVCLLAGGISFLYYRWMSYQKFNGITGDLAGYFLQICEFMILLGMVLVKDL